MRITSLVSANMWIAALVAAVAVAACSSENDPSKKAAPAASKDAGTSKDSGTSHDGGNAEADAAD